MNCVEIIKYIEELYPSNTAYDWDNVGLQVGTFNVKAQKILIALDITKEVVKEAINLKVNLIITHHPMIFNPIKNINFDSPRGWIIKNLIQNNIAVYSAHTNFDQAKNGMNDLLANVLGIKEPMLLDEEYNIGRYGYIDPLNFSDFVNLVKDKFDLNTISVIGKTDKTFKKISISGGSGSHHMYAAKKRNCDVYITGDVTYHTALDAKQLGITVFDVGHHIEVIFVKGMIDLLSKKFNEVEFIESKINTNPYKEF